MIVIDASALVDMLLGAPAAEAVKKRLVAGGEPPQAPHLLDVEVAQAIRRHAAAGEIDAERGRAALDDLGDFPLSRHGHHDLLPRIWELRRNFSAYDAVYVALAEALDAPLLTLDRRLARAVKRHTQVELA